MKLRIKGNSLRMRLTKSEVSSIQSDFEVKESTTFSHHSKLIYSLVASDEVRSMEARFENQTVRVLVPRPELLAWASSNTVSLKNYSEESQNDSLLILIEKDFFCLKPRTHQVEDESDLFHNPNEAHGSCG